MQKLHALPDFSMLKSIQNFLHKSADTNWEQASQVYSELPGKMVKQIATCFYHIPISDLKFYPILKKKVYFKAKIDIFLTFMLLSF